MVGFQIADFSFVEDDYVTSIEEKTEKKIKNEVVMSVNKSRLKSQILNSVLGYWGCSHHLLLP